MAVVVKTVGALAWASVKTRGPLAVASIKSWNELDTTAGGAAWYDSIPLASATSSVNYIGGGVAGNALGAGKVSLPTGTVTDLRVGNTFAFSTGTVKLALYDSSFDLVVGVTGVSIPATNDTTTEVAVTPTGITAGIFYVAAACSTDQILLGSLAGQAPASSLVTLTDDYAAMNVASIAAWAEHTAKYALGVKVG